MMIEPAMHEAPALPTCRKLESTATIEKVSSARASGAREGKRRVRIRVAAKTDLIDASRRFAFLDREMERNEHTATTAAIQPFVSIRTWDAGNPRRARLMRSAGGACAQPFRPITRPVPFKAMWWGS